MVQLLTYLYYVLQIIFLFYLALPFITVLLSLPIVLLKKKRNIPNNETDIGVVVTAYKDSEIFIPLADSLTKQNYSNYIVYIVADQCNKDAIKVNHEKIKVLIPEKALDSKVKSIQYAVNKFEREHSAVLIFDPDNLAHPNVLKEINIYLAEGYKAVQGRRTAKNLDTIYSRLDALGETYYNYTQREALFALGSSAAIAGSGMAIETELYKKNLSKEENKNEIVVAEDKILQADIVDEGYKIAYARDAVIYDEKVTDASQVERQRTRWLNSYFKYLKYAFSLMLKGIIKFDINRFIFGLTISTPPIIVLAGVIFLFLIINLFTNIGWFILWLAVVVLFISNFMLVLVLAQAEKELWLSFSGIPKFMLNQILALLSMKKSNKDFLVTEKTKILYIEDVLKSRNG